MAMLGYFDVFPEKRTTELRTATFEDGTADDMLPDGMFLFTEYFCTDPKCDCQRVVVKVFHARSENARPDEVATISYGWNPSSDDIAKKLIPGMPNPFLDPFHRQVSYAAELLQFWSTMIERDSSLCVANTTSLRRNPGRNRAGRRKVGSTALDRPRHAARVRFVRSPSGNEWRESGVWRTLASGNDTTSLEFGHLHRFPPFGSDVIQIPQPLRNSNVRCRMEACPTCLLVNSPNAPLVLAVRAKTGSSTCLPESREAYVRVVGPR